MWRCVVCYWGEKFTYSIVEVYYDGIDLQGISLSMGKGSRNKNVAIIGSGIAGLAAGHYLRHLNCEMYEAKPFLSLAGHGMELNDGKMIDIPLRVIHPEYYPRLFSLCRELGVKLRKLEHSGSFTLSNREEYFEYFSFSFFNKRINFVKPSWNYLKLGVGFLRFYRLSKKYMNNESYEKISFEEFLKRHKISKITTKLIILPLLSSICTCNYEELKKFPARVLLEMISRIAGPFPMERFLSGTKDVESALKGSLDKIYLDSKVQKIEVHDEYVEIHVNGQSKKYDHVVIATEAHLVKDFLVDNLHTNSFLSELNKIPYKTTDTIIHFVDNNCEQVLQEKSLHYQEHLSGKEAKASMWLNKVEPRLHLKENTMQTWNPELQEVNGEIKRTSLNRALMTVESYQAVKKLRDHKHQRISFVGSYLAKGVPLLEGGVESAFLLSKRL